jgi:hypothetical protein
MADNGQVMVTEQDQRAAVAKLREAGGTGAMSPDEVARRSADVWKAVTPRDLWRATGGLAGSPKRADAGEWRRAVIVMVAVVVFAAVAMYAILTAFRNIDEGPNPGLGPAIGNNR